MNYWARAYLGRLFSRLSVSIGASASIVCVLTGPFGTFASMTLGERATYWPLVIFLSLALAFAVQSLVARILPGLSEFVNKLVVATVFTAVYTPILYSLTAWYAADDSGSVMHPIVMALVVISVPMIFHALRNIVRSWVRSEFAVRPTSRPRLLRRLGDEADTIYRMSVRDHYVEVHSNLGVSPLLMRFSDALDEVEGVEGLRVHRSHWVAKTAVRDLQKDGTKVFLNLNCGARIPVSRSYRDQVISANFPGAENA